MTDTTGPDNGSENRFLSRLEAADAAGVHPRTIDRWIREGRLTPYRRRHNVFVEVRELHLLMQITLCG